MCVGSLFPQLKFLTYLRQTEHPFYAPFYAQWIPPTYPSIGSFFGGAPPHWRHITLQHLLTHTAGLLDYEDLIPPDITAPLRDQDVLMCYDLRAET